MMDRYKTGGLCIAILIVLSACATPGVENIEKNTNTEVSNATPTFVEPQDQSGDAPAESVNSIAKKEVDFSEIDAQFNFSARIPKNFDVEYVPESASINIFDPNSVEKTNLEKSVIFIRQFSANDFLTLQTVDVLHKEDTEKSGHPAVSYEIEKKSEVPNFPNQPTWRSEKHSLVDIRYSTLNPSVFYVFAYNPSFSKEAFDAFIDSIHFESSFLGFSDPLIRMGEREILKPYGIYITPATSPVSPEKFSGYHTALDIEMIPDEDSEKIDVYAICSGTIDRILNASGYGGYMVQQCDIEGDVYTVLYGHIDSSMPSVATGTFVKKGEKMAILGEGFTEETDNERTHLHLAIQKNKILDIRGYVQSKGALPKWIDPQEILPFFIK